MKTFYYKMFKLLEDFTSELLYQAEFDNPVTIIYNDNEILLTNKCIICIYQTQHSTNVSLLCMVSKIDVNGAITYVHKYKLRNMYSDNLNKNLRDTVKEINQAIEDTYKPGGYMYNKSEQIVEELKNKL